jgi:superfamily II DNA/RNA helicase
VYTPSFIHPHSLAKVFDEADRLLEEGFRADIDTIVGALPPAHKRQTLLFSATLSNALKEV